MAGPTRTYSTGLHRRSANPVRDELPHSRPQCRSNQMRQAPGQLLALPADVLHRVHFPECALGERTDGTQRRQLSHAAAAERTALGHIQPEARRIMPPDRFDQQRAHQGIRDAAIVGGWPGTVHDPSDPEAWQYRHFRADGTAPSFPPPALAQPRSRPAWTRNCPLVRAASILPPPALRCGGGARPTKCAVAAGSAGDRVRRQRSPDFLGHWAQPVARRWRVNRILPGWAPGRPWPERGC